MNPIDANGQQVQSIEGYLERERRLVDQALAAVTSDLLATVTVPLRSALEYALSTSGKRLRPILCVSAYRSLSDTSRGEPPAGLYRLSCALELVHTYSLVHDDLPCMDDDDLRRGRPTVHRVFGVRHAMLAGAALLPMAMSVLVREARALGLTGDAPSRLVRELAHAAGATGMVGGQLLDLEAESAPVGMAYLEAIHDAKTGALLTASVRLGAIAAGASEHALDALTHYGKSLGLAFQIADDILDVVGDSAALGKTAGRDEALRKASYPSIHGLEGARTLARRHAEDAKRVLADIHSPELAALADYVVERKR